MNLLSTSILKEYKSCTAQVINKKYNFTEMSVSSKENQNIGRSPAIQSATSIIQSFFANKIPGLISKPTIHFTSSKITIQLFYYLPREVPIGNYPKTTTPQSSENLSAFKKGISALKKDLAQFYKTEVDLVLTRLHYPYLNSTIFSKYLCHNASSSTFLNFQEAILTYPSISGTDLPAHVSGIKVEISGRLMTEPVIPRVTTKSTLIGSFNSNTPSSLIDYTKYTTKNELGAFTIKVWISQRKGNNH